MLVWKVEYCQVCKPVWIRVRDPPNFASPRRFSSLSLRRSLHTPMSLRKELTPWELGDLMRYVEIGKRARELDRWTWRGWDVDTDHKLNGLLSVRVSRELQAFSSPPSFHRDRASLTRSTAASESSWRTRPSSLMGRTVGRCSILMSRSSSAWPSPPVSAEAKRFEPFQPLLVLTRPAARPRRDCSSRNGDQSEPH